MSIFFDASEASVQSDIVKVLGADRLQEYLFHTNQNITAALRLYVWDAALSSAFLSPLRTVEVALRNAIDERLTARYTAPWYDDPEFLADGLSSLGKSIGQAKQRIVDGGKTVTQPLMVARLTFGFWVNLLRPRYARSLWPVLRAAFPRYTRRARASEVLEPLLVLRNRISHCQSIYDREPKVMYRRIQDAANLFSGNLPAWIDHHSRVTRLLDEGPVRPPVVF